MSQNEWEEQERIYGCWLCNCPDIGNRQLNLLTEICGGSEAAYFADSETWGKALSPKQVERLKRHDLDVPQATELCYRLRAAGVALPDIPLSVEECVGMFQNLLG